MNFYFDGRMKDEGREVSGVVRAVALPECAHLWSSFVLFPGAMAHSAQAHQNPAFVIKYVS